MNESKRQEIIVKVNNALDQLRPFLHADGGDMELVDVTNDAVVQVRLLGACSDCSMSAMTLKAGLVDALKSAAPEVKSVEAVSI
jgi:Fe-S cluster biogenesis protein NfuA